MRHLTYDEFLESKIETAPVSGFDIDESEINTALLPHQRDAVLWALHGGRRAIFASFGLGKSVIQIEFCRQCIKRYGGKALIVLPLGVRQEFAHDATEILGYDAPRYITHMNEIDGPGEILITNYERVRDGDIDPKGFTAVSLDEAAVLRSFGSKTYQTFLPKFKGVKYKMVATATPAPNKLKELIHYSGFLEIIDTGQALTRFFQRDSTKANNLTLYPHKVEEFWFWVSTWALYISKPSDLGYDDTGYDLPPMEVRTHVLKDSYCENFDRDGQYKLINDTTASLQEASREKKQTIEEWQLDAHGFWRDGGNRLLTKEELLKCQIDRLQAAYRKYSRDTVYNYEEHMEMCKKLDADGRLPATFMVMAPGSWNDSVWDDIARMKTLNSEQKRRDLQMHVCPLQIETVERLINRYSNPGDLIFDPFGGIGTVPYVALKMGRKGIMTELNSDYFRDAVGYLQEEEDKQDMPTLFDMVDGL